jgi:hypothetical protein
MSGSWQVLGGHLLIVGFLSAGNPPGTDASNARADLEKLAANLKFFALDDTMSLSGVPRAMAQKYREEVRPLQEKKYSIKDLVALLTHDDPRVRTLAAAALFARGDPKVLPFLVPLTKDPAETFPEPQLTAEPFPPVNALRLAKRTVAQQVNRMVQTYLIPAGYHYGAEGKYGNPGFEDYWAKRKDRAWCASWFLVDLHRASRGTRPTPRECIPAVKEVRRRIDQVPEPDRTFLLLWLHDVYGEDAFVTERELIAACKKIGPEALVKMLQRKIPSADPDLQPRPSNNYAYARMIMFVLKHARDLLRAEDADALLACERWERDYQKHRVTDPLLVAEWFLAAVELQPARAKEILKIGWDKFQRGHSFDADHRAKLALSWWHRVGKDDTAFVLNWFYDEKPQRGQFPHCRAFFLKQFGPKAPQPDRKLIHALIVDRRFDTLDWQTLQALGELINSWEKQPVIDPNEFRDTSHPYGMGHYHWMQDKARQEYPRETEQLQRVLARWRQVLRTYAALS